MHESQVVTVKGKRMEKEIILIPPPSLLTHTIPIAYSFPLLTFALVQFQYFIINWIRVLNMMCICFDTFHIWDTLFHFRIAK